LAKNRSAKEAPRSAKSAKVNFEQVFGAEKDIGCEPPSPGGAAVPGYTRILNVSGQSASSPPFFRS